MDTYLTKPVNRLQLEECIRTMLSRGVQAPTAPSVGSEDAPIGGSASNGHAASGAETSAVEVTNPAAEATADEAVANGGTVPPIDGAALTEILVGDVELIATLLEKFETTLANEWTR